MLRLRRSACSRRRWWGVRGSALAWDVGASVVARWWGDGVLTVLVLAHWCQKKKRRDPTNEIRCNGREEAKGGALQRVEAGWWLLWGGGSIND